MQKPLCPRPDRTATSAAAILCIAIGVGANTTILSVVNGILLRPIPGVADGTGLLEMG